MTNKQIKRMIETEGRSIKPEQKFTKKEADKILKRTKEIANGKRTSNS